MCIRDSTGDADEKDITLPEAGKNSVVEVKENTPPVVVGGVEEVAESQTDSSGSITVKLTVEQKDNQMCIRDRPSIQFCS